MSHDDDDDKPLDSYLMLCVGGLEREAIAATKYYLREWQRQQTHTHTEKYPEEGDWMVRLSAHGLDKTSASKPTPPAPHMVDEGLAGCGKVVLETDAPLNVVMSIPFFVSIMAYVCEGHEVSLDAETALPYIHQVIQEAPHWSPAMKVWARAQDTLLPPLSSSSSPTWTERIDEATATEESRIACKFRASALRDGTHHFRKYDVLPLLGNAISARLGEGTMKVDLVNFDLEAVAFISQQHFHLGLLLDNRRGSFCGTMLAEKIPPIVCKEGRMAALRPSTANLFLAMCRPQVGDCVCDVMCGVGTVPLMAAVAPAPFPQLFGLGGDHCEDACACARENFAHLTNEMQGYNGQGEEDVGGGRRRSAVAEFVAHWDARRLPLRDGVLDVAIVDLPFGKTKAFVKGVKTIHLYQQAFRELARVVRRDGGRVLLLAMQSKLVDQALGDKYNNGCWRAYKFGRQEEEEEEQEDEAINADKDDPLKTRREVNIGGLRGCVYLLERTAEQGAVWTPEEESERARRRRLMQQYKKEKQKQQVVVD